MFEGIKVSSLADIAQNTPLGSLRVYEEPDAMRSGLTAVGATVGGVKYEPVNTAFTSRYHPSNPIDSLADRGINDVLASREHWEISKFYWDKGGQGRGDNCKGGVTIALVSPLDEFASHDVGPHSIEYLWHFNWTGKSSDVELLSVIDRVCDNGMLSHKGLIQARYPHTVNRTITPLDSNILDQIKEHLDWKLGLTEIPVDDPRVEALIIQSQVNMNREEREIGGRPYDATTPTYYHWNDDVADAHKDVLHITPEVGSTYRWLSDLIDNPDSERFKMSDSESADYGDLMGWGNRARFARPGRSFDPCEVANVTINAVNSMKRAYQKERNLPRWNSSDSYVNSHNMKHVYDVLTRQASQSYKTPAPALVKNLQKRIEVLQSAN
tara:strand:- start:439 stop:1584 length:1146 start_codon:yes stop_codon:yes gene_type:complete